MESSAVNIKINNAYGQSNSFSLTIETCFPALFTRVMSFFF